MNHNLSPGRYLLQFVELKSLDSAPGHDQYATAQAADRPIFLGPKDVNGQLWTVTVQNVDEEQIIQLEAREVEGVHESAFLHHDADRHEKPLILSKAKSYKAKHERTLGAIKIYSLIPTDKEEADFTWYVGRNGNNQLALERVSHYEPLPHSAWAFHPCP